MNIFKSLAKEQSMSSRTRARLSQPILTARIKQSPEMSQKVIKSSDGTIVCHQSDNFDFVKELLFFASGLVHFRELQDMAARIEVVREKQVIKTR